MGHSPNRQRVALLSICALIACAFKACALSVSSSPAHTQELSGVVVMFSGNDADLKRSNTDDALHVVQSYTGSGSTGVAAMQIFADTSVSLTNQIQSLSFTLEHQFQDPRGGEPTAELGLRFGVQLSYPLKGCSCYYQTAGDNVRAYTSWETRSLVIDSSSFGTIVHINYGTSYKVEGDIQSGAPCAPEQCGAHLGAVLADIAEGAQDPPAMFVGIVTRNSHGPNAGIRTSENGFDIRSFTATMTLNPFSELALEQKCSSDETCFGECSTTTLNVFCEVAGAIEISYEVPSTGHCTAVTFEVIDNDELIEEFGPMSWSPDGPSWLPLDINIATEHYERGLHRLAFRSTIQPYDDPLGCGAAGGDCGVGGTIRVLCPTTAQPLPDEYDPVFAARMLLYSQIAYCAHRKTKQTVTDWTCKECLELPKSMQLRTPVPVSRSDPGGVKAFAGITSSKDTLVVAFRGSNNTENWIQNFKFKQDKFTGKEWVHKGFFQVHRSLRETLDDMTSKALYDEKVKNILISGHSLGGAVATLFLANLLDSAYKGKLPANHALMRPDVKIYLVTFGSPRVGNDAFANRFYTKSLKVPADVYVWRVINGRDPVPSLPKKGVKYFFQYHHVLREIYYPPDPPPQKYVVCGGGGEDRSCALELNLRASTSRHSLDNYRSRLFNEELQILSSSFTRELNAMSSYRRELEGNCPVSCPTVGDDVQDEEFLQQLEETAVQPDAYEPEESRQQAAADLDHMLDGTDEYQLSESPIDSIDAVTFTGELPPDDCDTRECLHCEDLDSDLYDISPPATESGESPASGGDEEDDGTVTRDYEWVVSYGALRPDGFLRTVITINHQFPAPTVHCNVGDRLRFSVTNLLPTETITIHWHGMLQRGSCEMDGVAHITQAPIRPFDTFLYEFVADNPGTHWYHSHSGAQYGDGLMGALIVRNKNDTINNEYAVAGEHIVLMHEWHHRNAIDVAVLLEHNRYVEGFDFFPPFVSGLVNGKGQYNCASECSYFCTPNKPYELLFPCLENAKREVFDRGLYYRFRLIGGMTGSTYVFSIDNHRFRVVAADGVEAYARDARDDLVDELFVYVGQRYDVIVHADQPVGNYWMRFRTTAFGLLATTHFPMHEEPAPTISPFSGEVLALLHYNGAPDAHAFQYTAGPDLGAGEVIVTDSNQLIPSSQQLRIEVPEPDHVIVLDFFCETESFECVINDIRFAPPGGDPLLLRVLTDVLDDDDDDDDDEQYRIAPGSTHMVTLKHNEHVRIILNNVGDMDHPFHLHGHHFLLLGRGPAKDGAFDGGKDLLLSDPMLRDTEQIEAESWMVFQFKADNPGVWFFHCHIEWHLDAGLAIVFNEAPERIPRPQSDWQDYHKVDLPKSSAARLCACISLPVLAALVWMW